MVATITHAAIGAAASGLATAAIHQAALDTATIAGIDGTNLDASAKLITVTGSSPASDGALIWNTTSLVATKGPSRRLQGYDSTAAAVLDFAEAYYSAATPAAAYQIFGLLWRDMTLHILRRWEDATTAPNGEAGWHPVDSAYQLWKNGSGGDILANKVVTNNPAGTTNLRTFTTTTVGKDQAVVGVTMEAILSGNYGVVAMVSGGAPCTVLVDSAETNGVVAQGDFLATFTTAGVARTVGPQTANQVVANGKYTVGTPRGAFAIALGVKDGSNLVKCKMLGFVGAGAMGMQVPLKLWSDTTPTGTPTIDASVQSSGDATQGAVSSVINTKHLPLCAVNVSVAVNATATGVNASVSTNFLSTSDGPIVAFRANGSGAGYGGRVPSGFFGLPNASNSFQASITLAATNATVVTYELWLDSYIY